MNPIQFPAFLKPGDRVGVLAPASIVKYEDVVPGIVRTRPVQRIRYRDNETNYCPRCQTEGRLLADRALSRLLKEDWPRTVEELE